MTSLLNSEYQDERNLELEKLIKYIFNIDIKKFMIYPIENIGEELLPVLSKEYHIQGFEGWNLAKTKEEKQKLIANSFKMHSQKGTKISIKTALKNFGIDCELFETNRPAHFIAELNVYNSNINKSDIMALIENYKPVTRVLDFIRYILTNAGNFYTGARTVSLETVCISTKGVIEL